MTTAGAVAESLAIGPIVSVGLFAYLVAGASGANAPLVVAVVFAGTLALGWTVSLYGRRFAGAGTVYEYVALAHNRALGGFAAGLYFLPTLITWLPALVSSLLLQEFCVRHLGFDPGWWTGGVLSTALVFALSYLGVRPSVRVVLALTCAAAIPLLVAAVAILAQGGESGLTLRVFDPGTAGGGDIFSGVLFGALLFVGFEGAACLGEESRQPHRVIPRAILLSIGVTGAFYLLMVYSATIGFGPEKVAQEWGGDPVGFAGLGDRFVGQPLSELIALGIVIDNLAAQLAIANIVGRGFFTLARDGLLPRRLARVSRHGTPVMGLALVSLAGLGVLASAAVVEDHFDIVSLMAVAFTLTVLPAYIVLGLGGLRFVGSGPRAIGRALAVLVGAAVPVLGIYGTFDPFPTGTRRAGIAVWAVAVLGVAAWWLYVRTSRPRELARAGEHAARSGQHAATRLTPEPARASATTDIR